MTVEDHPHVIPYPDADPEAMAIWPYLLRIPGGPNIALTQEDMLILHATCDRILKEGEE